jgi:hypothetical protein
MQPCLRHPEYLRDCIGCIAANQKGGIAHSCPTMERSPRVGIDRPKSKPTYTSIRDQFWVEFLGWAQKHPLETNVASYENMLLNEEIPRPLTNAQFWRWYMDNKMGEK